MKNKALEFRSDNALPLKGLWVRARWPGQLSEVYACIRTFEFNGRKKYRWEIKKGAAPITDPLYFIMLDTFVTDKDLDGDHRPYLSRGV